MFNLEKYMSEHGIEEMEIPEELKNEVAEEEIIHEWEEGVTDETK